MDSLFKHPTGRRCVSFVTFDRLCTTNRLMIHACLSVRHDGVNFTDYFTTRGMEMKKNICLVFAVIALLMASALPGHAWDRFGVGVYVGPGWYGPFSPYPYYVQPPIVIQQQPPVYVQPAPQYAQPDPQQEEQYYWYFCPNPRGYYPYVKQCPSGWLRVVPSSPPPAQGTTTVPSVPSSNQGPTNASPAAPSIPPDLYDHAK